MFLWMSKRTHERPESFYNTRYSALNNVEGNFESEESWKKGETTIARQCSAKHAGLQLVISWVLVVVLCMSNLWTALRLRSYHSLSGTVSNTTCNRFDMKSSEFTPARGVLSLQPVRFTSGIRHDINGTLYRTNPEQQAFVGEPSPSIDVAWYELTKGLDLYVTPSEAAAIDEDMHLFPETGMYQTEVEWLHNLHCLNYIRKSFDLEYYTADLHHPEQSHIAHRDHCINALRQVLTCHGDMTPLPKKWDNDTGKEFTDFERVHTCRDVERMRKWATERSYDRYEKRFKAESEHRG